MGTTADKLNYLKDTKELLRQELNNDFTDLNITTDDPFREYPSRINSSRLWMDAWIGGEAILNVNYDGTRDVSLYHRVFNNISIPNVTNFSLINVTAKTVIAGGPTSGKRILDSSHISEAHINNLQRIDITKNDSTLYDYLNSNIAKLYLPSLSSVAGKKIFVSYVYAITSPTVYLPKISTIGSYGISSSYLHIGTELSTVCVLNTNGIDSVAYIYVPASLVDSYKSATNWSSWADKIYAEPGT